ncbi:MAG: phosphodiester glycosidase family protein [Desulfohalobiaceae bacterium]
MLRSSWGLLFFLLLLLAAVALQPGPAKAKDVWQELETGLELATEESLCEQDKDACLGLKILRIDPEYFQLVLLSASESGHTKYTLKGWGQEYDLRAAINAGMFWKDLETSAGYMKNFKHVNNKTIHPEFNAFLVFNPVSSELPAVQLIDRANQPQWENILQDYQSVVQSYRMISNQGQNVWEKNSKSYSVASVGLDEQGRILFIFSEQPRTIHDLNKTLLELPLGIQSCIFMEGGPTAGLYLDAGSTQTSWQGSSEFSLWSNKPGSYARVPNALGIIKKKE